MLIKRTYYILRYYPHRPTQEFFNIGVILEEGDRFGCKLLENDHLKTMKSFPNVDAKILKNTIKSFVDSTEGMDKGAFIYFLTRRCRNLIESSAEILTREKRSFEEHLQFLYNQYVGKKFNIKQKSSTLKPVDEK